MALPIGVQNVTVHIGNSFAVAGTEATITGTISPIFGGTVRRAIWQATGGALSSVTERFESIDGGKAFVQVPDPHQAGWVVPETGADGQTLYRAISDWGYRVDAVARFPGGGGETITKMFKIAPGQTSVDLDLVADGQVVSGVQGPYVPAGSPGAVDSLIADVAGVREAVFGTLALVAVPGGEAVVYDANYMQLRPVSAPTTALLQQGVAYTIDVIPNETFTLTMPLQFGTGPSAAAMVDTLAPAGTQLTAGTPLRVDYTPSADGLRYVRLVGNAARVAAINTYTSVRSGGLATTVADMSDGVDSADDAGLSLAHKVNAQIRELRTLRNQVDASLSALSQVQDSPGTSQTATISGTSSRLLRVGLHYGASRYTPQSSEIFFNGSCRKDLTDIRFFDASGKMLKARLGELVNLDLLEDSNLNNLVKISPNGLLVGYDAGIVTSTDNGVTWTLIAGTTNVTTKASDQYARLSMYPVHVDASDNIYAYAGGVLYKLLAADNWATKTAVLTYSWSDAGTMVYPDIQNHAIDVDSTGILYMGPYQTARHAVVYRSTDTTGTAWEVCWTGNATDHQHVHHIHSDPHTGKTYVGVDDGGTTYEGARILVTADHGTTWTEIPGASHGVRGMDYFPTYFGDGYRLGGGESYYSGGGTVIRSTDDATFTLPVLGVGGVRSYVDFGDDSLIIAGVQQASGTSENQIIVSEDQGKSWRTIYRKHAAVESSSGRGFRDGHGATLIQGDTKPCAVLTMDNASGLRSMRIYKGGDHWYREATILLDKVPSGPVTITATSGYMAAYPYRTFDVAEHSGLVYRVPLDEGLGRYVTDSEGTTARIQGTGYRWDSREPVRHGDHGGTNLPQPLAPSSGLRVEAGTSINLGQPAPLQGLTDFTLAMWVSPSGMLMDAAEYAAQPASKGILSVGNLGVIHRQYGFGITARGSTTSRLTMQIGMHGYPWLDQYAWIVISVTPNKVIQTYINGTKYSYTSTSNKMAAVTPTLSGGDFVIGPDPFPSAGYLSDIRVYNRVIPPAEVLEMYRGV